MKIFALVTMSLVVSARGQFIGGANGLPINGVATNPTGTVNIGPANTAGNIINTLTNNPNTHQAFGYNKGFNGFFFNNQNNALTNCPNQTDYSADLLLSSDSTGYPVDAINAELAGRRDLQNCLLREIVPPTAPKVPDDPLLARSKDACPSSTPMLWSFFRYNGRCWLLQNVQEMFNFTICGTITCQNCQNSYSGFGSENRCYRAYQYFSVWAYCEGLTALNRVSRERIILPVACVCKKVRCYANNYFWKRK